MEPQGWLPITEYAGKYRVSISTLRRRIKSGEVKYSFNDGKYFLKDEPLVHSATVAPPQVANGGGSAGRANVVVAASAAMNEDQDDSPILATANRLLNELKKAYSLILQEKEEQILILKDEVADLRTLVKVLESENERLNKSSLVEEPWID